jgi:hypothetical protein
MSRPPLEVADIIRSRREAFERQSRGWINGQHRKVVDTSPAISANAHEVGRMTLHPQHRRNCLAHNQQEIPALISAVGLTLISGYSILHRRQPLQDRSHPIR